MRCAKPLHDVVVPPFPVWQKYCEDLEDASSELMLCDEEQVKYSFGWVFVHMDTDGADTRLESATEEAREEITQLEGEIGDVRKNMDELKGVLYAKFGSAINLEEE